MIVEHSLAPYAVLGAGVIPLIVVIWVAWKVTKDLGS